MKVSTFYTLKARSDHLPARRVKAKKIFIKNCRSKTLLSVVYKITLTAIANRLNHIGKYHTKLLNRISKR